MFDFERQVQNLLPTVVDKYRDEFTRYCEKTAAHFQVQKRRALAALWHSAIEEAEGEGTERINKLRKGLGMPPPRLNEIFNNLLEEASSALEKLAGPPISRRRTEEHRCLKTTLESSGDDPQRRQRGCVCESHDNENSEGDAVPSRGVRVQVVGVRF